MKYLKYGLLVLFFLSLANFSFAAEEKRIVDSIYVVPSWVTIPLGAGIRFMAYAYDKNNKRIKNFVPFWSTDFGRIDQDGYYWSVAPGMFRVYATDPETEVEGFGNVEVYQKIPRR